MDKLKLLMFFLFLSSYATAQQGNYSYQGGRDPNTGLRLVQRDGKYGYIDDAGKEVIPIIYERIGDFGDGNRLAFAKFNGKYGYIDRNGTKITDFKYGITFGFDWDNLLAPVALDESGKFGYIDIKGNEVIPFKYEIARLFSDGLAAVMDNKGKFGFIDESGKTVVPFMYDNVKWGFYDGHVWVERNGKWGMIDKSNQTVISFLYDDIAKFDLYTGFADLRIENRLSFYDMKGRRFVSSEDRKKRAEMDSKELPDIDWINFKTETDNPTMTFNIGIKSKTKVTNVAHKVVNNVSRGINVVQKDAYSQKPSITVNLSEGPNKIIVYVTNEAGEKSFEKTVMYRSKNAPQIIWNVAQKEKITTSSPTYKIAADIKSSLKITEVYILMNDGKQPNRGVQPAVSDNFEMKINETVTLREGINTVRLFARNAAGQTTSTPLYIDYVKPQPQVKEEKRIALVVGNSIYKHKYMFSDLPNAKNDANDVASKLEELGFKVIRAFDTTYETLDSKIRSFEQIIGNYDVALFYYAGHGLQLDNKNYWVPTDASINSQSQIRSRCINSDEIIDVLNYSQCKMKIMIIDACRNDVGFLPETTSRSRGMATRGLAKFDPPTGIKIARSTRAGETAYDGIPPEKNSPYTAALLKAMDMPHVEFETLLKDIYEDVVEKTKSYEKGSQYPDNEGTYTGRFYINNK